MKSRIAGLLAATWLWIAAAPAHAAIKAWLDSTQIASGETVQLTLEYNGLTNSEPDLAPLRVSFDVLGTSSSTSVQIGTGGVSEHTEAVLTLSPKHAGQLTVPSISWNGQQSPALVLQVTGAGSAAAQGAAAGAGPARVFIESIATPARPYVQAAVQLTVQIYTDEQLYHGSLDFTGNGAALVRKVGRDEYTDTVRNGRSYQVITRRYVVFPLRSGTVTLPGPVLDAEAAAPPPRSSWGGDPFGGFFGNLVQRTEPIRVHGDPISLSVRPRPAGAAGNYWIPAQSLTLSGQWNPDTLTAQTGNPLTVALDLSAVGLTAAQLPDLSRLLRLPAGLKAYADQAKLDDSARGQAIVGTRDQTIAFIADRPGRYTIPAITIRWWDTQTNQSRSATWPAQTLTVLPGGATMTAATPPPIAAPAQPPLQPHLRAPSPGSPPAAAASSMPTSTSRAFRWRWLSAALAALWLVTIGGWLVSRRRTKPAAAAKPASSVKHSSLPAAGADRAAFRRACAANDATGARRHLLAWAHATWGVAPTGLVALGAALGDPRVAALLRELDRACYGGSLWQGQPLAQALISLPPRPGKPSRPRDDLAPLYP